MKGLKFLTSKVAPCRAFFIHRKKWNVLSALMVRYDTFNFATTRRRDF